MDIAIHKSTNKPVSAYQIAKSLQWKGKEREEFIAPEHSIGNWLELKNKGISEVKVSFVIEHTRKSEEGKILVIPHFRIITEGAIENIENESEEHKLAKEYIYSNLVQDKISLKIKSIGTKRVSELAEVEDIRIERGVGNKRADVLLKFKEYHQIYGNGIAFEIQLSPQKEKSTTQRSYDRACYGYSVVWIWSEDLNEQNTYELMPFNESLNLYKEQEETKLKNSITDISNRFDFSLQMFNKILSKDLEQYNILREKTKEDLNLGFQNLELFAKNINESNLKETEEILKQKLQELKIETVFQEKIDNYLKESVDLFFKVKDHELIDKINNIFASKLNVQLDSLMIENKLKEKIEEKVKLYEFNFKEELKEKIKIYLNSIKESLKKEYAEALTQDIKNSMISQTKGEIKLMLEKDLLELKGESISNYNKNKSSVYFECFKCKKDKHISLCQVDETGKRHVCISCLEQIKDDNKKSENKTA